MILFPFWDCNIRKFVIKKQTKVFLFLRAFYPIFIKIKRKIYNNHLFCRPESNIKIPLFQNHKNSNFKLAFKMSNLAALNKSINKSSDWRKAQCNQNYLL